MAYEAQTWETGHRITAEKMNHIEQGIAQGSDPGYSCIETTTLLTDESVTTVSGDKSTGGTLTYSTPDRCEYNKGHI